MSRSLVIALDSSDLSARALPFAQAIAEQWRGRLILVHASRTEDGVAPVPLELELHDLVRRLSEEGINADAVTCRARTAKSVLSM